MTPLSRKRCTAGHGEALFPADRGVARPLLERRAATNTPVPLKERTLNSTKLVRLSAASAVLLASFGCHRPTPAEIAEQAAENTAALITEAGETSQSVNDRARVSDAFQPILCSGAEIS